MRTVGRQSLEWKCSTHHCWKQWHTTDTFVPNMCSNLSMYLFSFPLTYNMTPFKWSNCDNRCKMLETVYRRMTFGTFITVYMREYTPALPSEGTTLSFDVTVWAPLTVLGVFHLPLGNMEYSRAPPIPYFRVALPMGIICIRLYTEGFLVCFT